MPYADPDSPAALASRRRGSRAYYARHREAEIARSAAWSRGNRDKVNSAAVARRSQRQPIEKVLFHNAQQRSRAQGIEFTITLVDIVVPERCPVLGLKLVVNTGHAKKNSPSLDRIDPSKGYVPGNVRVISHKANTIKSDASAADLRAVLKYIKEHKHGHSSASSPAWPEEQKSGQYSLRLRALAGADRLR